MSVNGSEPGITRATGAEVRPGITHKIEFDNETVGGMVEGYVTGNWSADGTLREVFLHGFGKEGSTLRGWTDFSAIVLSLALQGGTDFSAIIRRVGQMRFEPYGRTRNPEIPFAPSVPAYVVCWLALRMGSETDKEAVRTVMSEWAGVHA